MKRNTTQATSNESPAVLDSKLRKSILDGDLITDSMLIDAFKSMKNVNVKDLSNVYPKFFKFKEGEEHTLFVTRTISQIIGKNLTEMVEFYTETGELFHSSMSGMVNKIKLIGKLPCFIFLSVDKDGDYLKFEVQTFENNISLL